MPKKIIILNRKQLFNEINKALSAYTDNELLEIKEKLSVKRETKL